MPVLQGPPQSSLLWEASWLPLPLAKTQGPGAWPYSPRPQTSGRGGCAGHSPFGAVALDCGRPRTFHRAGDHCPVQAPRRQQRRSCHGLDVCLPRCHHHESPHCVSAVRRAPPGGQSPAGREGLGAGAGPAAGDQAVLCPSQNSLMTCGVLGLLSPGWVGFWGFSAKQLSQKLLGPLESSRGGGAFWNMPRPGGQPVACGVSGAGPWSRSARQPWRGALPQSRKEPRGEGDGGQGLWSRRGPPRLLPWKGLAPHSLHSWRTLRPSGVRHCCVLDAPKAGRPPRPLWTARVALLRAVQPTSASEAPASLVPTQEKASGQRRWEGVTGTGPGAGSVCLPQLGGPLALDPRSRQASSPLTQPLGS